MAKPFLIVGLPRSRTAWMSVAATTAQSICYHEPISRFDRWQDVANLWKSEDYEFVGVSDSSMGLHLSELLRTSSPRTLVIERPLIEVIRSLEAVRINGARKYCEVLSRRITAAVDDPLVMKVRYDQLSDAHVVGRCLRWLMPGLGADMNRIGELVRMNIQAEMDGVWKAVESRKADLPSLFGEDVWQELSTSTAA